MTVKDSRAIKGLEREVRVGHVRDERRHDAAPRLFGGKVSGARGFVRPTEPTPHIEFPRESESGLE
jgi:hypothetical protein